MTSQLNRREEVAPPSVRAPDTSPVPMRRSGGAPVSTGGRDSFTPRSPARGRGPGGQEPVPPWAVLVPGSATSIDVRTQRTEQCLRQIAVLPPEAWVSIVDDRPLSRLRLRRLAHRAGLVIERELIVLRTADGAAAVVEDVGPAPGRARSLSAPPFSGGSAVAPAVPLWLVRTLPWSWTRWLASDRVLLARRQ